MMLTTISQPSWQSARLDVTGLLPGGLTRPDWKTQGAVERRRFFLKLFHVEQRFFQCQAQRKWPGENS